MEHAEAHERLSDLALEPRRLARLEDDPSQAAAELRAHVAGCDDCTADVAAWRRTWAEVGAVTGDTGSPGDRAVHALGAVGIGTPILPPSSLRERILGAVRAEGAGRPAEPATPRTDGGRRPAEVRATIARSRLARPWMVTAAAVVVALIAASSTWIRTTELDQLRAHTAELAAAAAALDRVLASEPSWTVALRAADGTSGGTLAWSSHEVVVITSGLSAPGPGQKYRCWVERDGARTPMGWMAFSDSTGYWAGALDEYGPSLPPGGRFGVSLVPAAGTATPVLVGEL